MQFDLKALIGTLNPTCRQALEAAAGLCVAQSNYNVEIEHLLLKLLEPPDTDVQRLLRYYEVPTAALARELTRSLEQLQRGNSRTPTLSPHIPRVLQDAWLLASLHLGGDKVRSGALLLALLEDESLRGVLLEAAPTLLQIPRDRLRQESRTLLRGTAEDTPAGAPAVALSESSAPGPEASRAASPTPALDQYTIDLTARARAGLVDPVQGREAEIRQIIDILLRRRQNNPLLTGEAGVGKTAVVEGFARRIAQGEVPPALQQVALRVLDLGLLQAGAGVRGEFENRLKAVIAEVKSAPQPIILFIDEAHTMIGAGGPAGQGDAANLLKPALARGELRTVAATTWAEYKRYFEKDPALARRFQVIQVDEPDEAGATDMLRSMVAHLEQHHQVRILDEAVHEAVRLSQRYITGRQLPDKAMSVLDTACARVALGCSGTPPAVEDVRRRLEGLELELAVLQREQAAGRSHGSRLQDLAAARTAALAQRAGLERQWQEELALVRQLTTLERQCTALPDTAVSDAALLQQLTAVQQQLKTLQGPEPMVPTCVDARVIAAVVSGWTGIPLGTMLADEIQTLLHLQEHMERRLIGQPQALDTICRRIRTARAGLDDPDRPVGVFLLVGPSGVGKTETALTLADLLYGGERHLVVLNMSEYQEPYTVSTLKGAPPGYVGYGKGGVLTEAVRRNPYSVVLLDEVEKAHPDVLEMFYQVFDKGSLEDSEGVLVSFHNTVILLTCNIGAETIVHTWQDVPTRPSEACLLAQLRPLLLKYFKPALLSRLVIVPYYPLGDDEIRAIVRLKLQKIQQRFQESHRAALTYDATLVEAIAARCTEVDSGARNVDHILTQTLLPELAGVLLERMALGQPCTGVQVACNGAGAFVYCLQPA
ncbi:MAG: type VI secretion system ATPase TssH [Candidatus Tectimicrobiota bacterium]